MRKFSNRWKSINWKLTFLMLLSMITMIAFGFQKEGYHVDEIYSYGLANSEYLPFMHFGDHDYNVKDWMLEYGAGESLGDLVRNLVRDFRILKECNFQFRESVIYRDYVAAQANSADTRTTTWVSGQDYRDYLTASESNTFNYASVYYNQRGDVHPPLYYILLHTVCSVFQGMFSKWFALSINIVFLLLTLLVLYKMVKEHLGGETAALAVVGVYGLSGAFMSNAVFLRMYAMLTFMVVSYCYVHLQTAGQDFCLKGRNRRKLMLTVLGGFLTHYYFVLYAIGMAVVFTVWMMTRKKWREIIRYLLALAASAAIGLCIWPYALRHVFSGYRGQEALNVFMEREFYYIKIKVMFDQIITWLYDGQWWIIWVCLCAIVIFCIRKRGRNLSLAKGLLIVVPVFVYIAAVAQIAPGLTDRYVMCTYPFWYLFVIEAVALGIRIFPDRADRGTVKRGFLFSKWREGILILAGLALFILSSSYRKMPFYLYLDGQETVKVPQNTDCVYVLPTGDWNESAIDSTILAQCRRVAIVYQAELECLADTYEYQDGDFLMVAIHKDMEIEAVLEEVSDVLGVEGLTETDRQEGSVAVRILLTR